MVNKLDLSPKNMQHLYLECSHYKEIIRYNFPLIPEQHIKVVVQAWIYKLEAPCYDIPVLKDKRNRFLMMLAISCLNRDFEEVFLEYPPANTLPELHALTMPNLPAAEHEISKEWQKIIQKHVDLDNGIDAKSNKVKKCSTHTEGNCPTQSELDKKVGDLLDKHFNFYLHLALSRGSLANPDARPLVSHWIDALCLITPTACAATKGIRNDYMMSFLGYLSNKQLIGPFSQFPPDKLLPICKAAKMYNENRPPNDPTHPRAELFMSGLPQPAEGAFAFVAINGSVDRYDQQ